MSRYYWTKISKEPKKHNDYLVVTKGGCMDSAFFDGKWHKSRYDGSTEFRYWRSYPKMPLIKRLESKLHYRKRHKDGTFTYFDFVRHEGFGWRPKFYINTTFQGIEWRYNIMWWKFQLYRGKK